MNISEEQRRSIKHVHQQFLYLPEIQALIQNLIIKYNNQIEYITEQSVCKSLTDVELRIACVKAQAMKELIDYVRTDPTSIFRNS